MSRGAAACPGTAACPDAAACPGAAVRPESRPQPVKAAPNTINRMEAALSITRYHSLWTSLERKQIFQCHADEHGHSEIVVVEEGAKAAIAITPAYQPQLIREEQRPRP